MTAGMSRSNIYTAEELQSFAGKLVNAPVYISMLLCRMLLVGNQAGVGWACALWGGNLQSEVADKSVRLDPACRCWRGL